MKSNKDYDSWDLEALPVDAIPRTSYQPAKGRTEYLAGYTRWCGKSATDFFRLAWRNMIDGSTERSMHAAIIPPGPTHVHAVHSLATEKLTDLVLAVGAWSSIPIDFMVKVSGTSKVRLETAARIPHPAHHPLVQSLILRALRLNCLTINYSPIWEQLFDSVWSADDWTIESENSGAGYRPIALASQGKEWTSATPLRRDFDRRLALIEIDALVAVMLDITADELCSIYRTQFGVLRKYERQNRYDANGRKVPGEIAKAHQAWLSSGSAGRQPDLGRYVPPFIGMDREADMTLAHVEFTRRLAQGQPAV